MPKKLLIFESIYTGKNFLNWLNQLKDVKARAVIRARLERLKLGQFGDCRTIGGQIKELRIFFGPGYRVYYGEDQENIIILLYGGDKGSQKKDIAQAKLFWMEYKYEIKKLSK